MIDYNGIRKQYINADCGFYTAGAQIFFTKAQALLYASKNKLDIQYHFNNKEFSEYPWHKEPTESLEQLYLERALQLRETYDYLVLLYSAGSDSTNMLRVFLDNKIPLDHVISWGAWNRHVDKMDRVNVEITVAGDATIKEIISRGIPFTHLNLLDDNIIGKAYQNSDWILDAGSVFAPLQELLNRSLWKNTNLLQLANKGKKVCILWGKEKPIIIMDEYGPWKGYYLQINDMAFAEHAHSSWHNTGIFYEYFYTNPKTTKLQAKQIHKIINYLEKNYNYEKMVELLNTNSKGDSWKNEKNNILSTVLYEKTWKPKTFSLGKSGSHYYTPRWNCFLKNTTSEQYKNWQGALNDLHNSAEDKFKNRIDSFTKKPTFNIFINRYFIKRVSQASGTHIVKSSEQ
jgi:hypothetical protein